MAKKIIKNWVHISGMHCGSVALRDVITYHGYNWSEAMCFGIGGGLGFYYAVRDDISPTRMIFVRGPEMEPTFFSLIDKPTSWKYEEDNNRALEEAKEWIDRDIPVLIQTDVYYLDYYNTSTNFPGHIVSLWGYDDENETVFLADTAFEGLQAVPYEKFKGGRVSKATTNPLYNNWFEVNPRKPIRPLSEVIPEAIRENARKMIEGRTGGRGESGVRMIRLWSEDLPNWTDAEDWSWCARFGYQVIKKRGVDGAGFRWLYRDFLREAEEIVPSLKKLNLSKRMDLIANRWSDIAMVLKEISEKEKPDVNLLEVASDKAKELWELEEEFYRMALDKLRE
ncbi:MAG TPA: BtrH N-terminal domain-containing protein [Thermodesulfobacteriota bacterium]|nr:BtrH N-terminal domain-containing protein [Thermodesulfobacteriota bacterium]